MDYLQRYKQGECEPVWAELTALGDRVREPEVFEQARQVAEETMRRVRRNLEKLVARLRAMDYQFGVYPDGSTGYYTSGPLVQPAPDFRSNMQALEQAVGPLPLSLVAFWEQVGSVDFVGMLRSWPSGLDPLVVNGPEGAVWVLDEIEEHIDPQGRLEADLAPDALHKDNTSGGSPYAVLLPEPGADFILRNEGHDMYFVPYLRFAMLRYGGFPGLDGGSAEFNALPTLLDDLEPF